MQIQALFDPKREKEIREGLKRGRIPPREKARVDQTVDNRLSDGRVVRALEGTFKQADMFRLKGRIPSHESIMTVRDLDDALNASGAWKAIINANGWWRTNRYGVYARGFESELDKAVGASIVWVEDGIPYTFEVPDVRHPHDPDRGLRQAAGMLDFALDKLQYDEGRRIVSVTSDFDPEIDVAVRDIMRPSGWALVDADGYPLRTWPSDADTSEARYSVIFHSKNFNDRDTGWHGSVARGVKYRYCSDPGERGIDASDGWHSGSEVAVVGHKGA